SMRLTNPIRDIVDQLKLPQPPPKPLIALSIGKKQNNYLITGDPTVYGNFDNPQNINDALIENIKSRKLNGYGHSAVLLSTYHILFLLPLFLFVSFFVLFSIIQNLLQRREKGTREEISK